MTLPGFSLRNRHTIWALSIAVVVFGGAAYVTLPIQLFPETAPPLVNILTAYPGAAALDVADLVSKPIEEECASLEGVRKVSSTSQDGLSLVSVEFGYDTSVDLGAIDAQNAISRIRATLPSDVGEPQVLKFSTSDRPVLTIGLVGEDPVRTRRLAEDLLSAEVQRVRGVAMVDVFGGNEPEITVEVDRDLLEAHGVGPGSILQAIRSHNVSLPAGQIRSAGRQSSFRIDERTLSPEAIAAIPLTTPSGSRILVGDVGSVREGGGEDLSRYRVNGEAAIAMQVFKQDDANTVDVVDRAQAVFDDFERRYPGIRFVVAEESASFTQQVVRNMLGSVFQALFLASVVIFLFLGSFRRGIVVAVSMPMSFLLTFAAMKIMGIQLDLVTLTAIILAVGMVVDGSVVVLENITRRYQDGGLTREEAAAEGASEIQFAVIAGNATTLVVLVPLLFLYGFVGKTFGPLAATLIIAFLSSLIVALTLVPVLTAIVGRDGGRMEDVARRLSVPWNWAMNRLRDAYLGLLARSLRAHAVVFATAGILFVLGLVILRFQGMELLPKMDSGQSFVTVETPSGSSLDETERVLRDVEQVLLDEPEIVRISNQMGFEPGMHSFGGGGVQGPTQSYVSITFTPRTARSESVWEIQDRLRERLARIPGIQNLVVRESGSTAKATTASSIVVSLRGADPWILDRLGEDVLARTRSVDGVINPYRSWRIDQRSTILAIDADRARELGLDPSAAARELVLSLDGQLAGVLRGELGEETPIRVRYAEPFRRHPADALAVRTLALGEGRPVPIRAAASARDVRVQGLVTRENLQPTLNILALHQDRPLSFVNADVAAAASGVTTPVGYTVEMEGENKDMAESRNELAGALMISVVAVYLLLVAQFRSFLHPITVLVSVPLSLIGVSIALALGGRPISMPVMVGLILLVGIVVNNSIILLDFIRKRRDEGMDRHAAILDAVRTRFRPIMMTSFSTIAGMIPLAAEWALGAERFSPLAVAVIGGMTASTFLTLIVIPVLYDS
ncbi:efflux RND transporter permease subunit, partial [bacterium]|nr:efflux RND transporter permease subunit [bacterium]